MSPEQPPIGDTLSPTQFVEINRICDRVEAECGAGGRPSIESLIADTAEPMRSALLQELLAVELECRRLAGENPLITDYRTRFPDHTAIVDAAFAVRDDSIPGPEEREFLTAPLEPGQRGSDLRRPKLDSDPATIGRYQVIERLGQGGFGRVYLAFDTELDRRVAIKVPKSERISRSEDVETYLSEARALARLDHPHIVPVHDVGRTEDGVCYVVSKFVEGSDLAERMRRGRLPFAEVAELIATVAGALYHAAYTGADPSRYQAGQYPAGCRRPPVRGRFRPGVARREFQ